MSEERIRQIVARHRGTLGEVPNILHEVQRAFGCIPEPALRIVAELTGRSMVDLYGAASFHSTFRLVPPVMNGAGQANRGA